MELKNTIYQTIAIFLIIILCLIVFLVYPLLRDIKSNSGKILSDNAKAIFVESEIKELENFEKNYQEYRPHLNKIDGLFVDVKNPIDFIRFLEKTASDSQLGIEINLLPQQKSLSSNVVPAVFFQIYTKGDFVNMVRFSERLESGDYLIMINNMTIKKATKLQDASKNIDNKVEGEFLLEIIQK